MSTGAFRTQVAKDHEFLVDFEIRARGFVCGPYADIVLPPSMRATFRSYEEWAPERGEPTRDVAARWTPDFIAISKPYVYLVDAKCCLPTTDTGNHSVEAAALDKYWSLSHEGPPVLMVFDDLMVMNAREPQFLADKVRDGRGTKGSGTPFVLVPAHELRHMDEYFGKPL